MRNIISLIAFIYIAIIFYFTSSSWGLALGTNASLIYDRGVGVLGLPILNIMLYIIYICTALLGYEQRTVYSNLNIRYFFWCFNTLFFMFSFYGLVTGVPFRKVFSGEGLTNIFNMYLMILILLKIISTPERLNRFSDFIIFWVLTRGTFGFVRWAFFGGDPANVYANQQNVNVRITFFDINDNLVAMLGVFIAAWVLMYGKPGLTNVRKFFYLLTIVIGLAVIILSYRRTAWGGLVLAGLWFLWQQPWRRRIQVGFFAGLIGLLALPVVISERFSSHGLLVDITSNTGKITTKIGRFRELDQAWRYIAESPFTGVMPWGGMGPGGSHSYVHSGIIHLWLKGGIFALIFFCLIICFYYLFTQKARKEIPAQDRCLLEAGFAGFLFILPSFLFGTTVAEFRACLIIGVVFALPYLVYGLRKPETTQAITSPYALKAFIKAKSIAVIK